MLKKINVEDAVGSELAHDITEIRPGEFKGAAFRKGHTVCNEDICHLQKLGKNHLYLVDLEEDEIHENQAATILAGALAGENIEWDDDPKEGKIALRAAIDGLLHIDTAALAAFNMVDEVMCATLHSHTLVKKGQLVAATRAIPLVMQKAPVERAAAIARQNGAVVAVRPLHQAQVGIVITGNEVFHGLIDDKFAPILSEKVTDLGSRVNGVTFAPDDPEKIEAAIRIASFRGLRFDHAQRRHECRSRRCDPQGYPDGRSHRDLLRRRRSPRRHVPGGLYRRRSRWWVCRPVVCTIGRPRWIWFCRVFWQVSISARPSWPS